MRRHGERLFLDGAARAPMKTNGPIEQRAPDTQIGSGEYKVAARVSECRNEKYVQSCRLNHNRLNHNLPLNQNKDSPWCLGTFVPLRHGVHVLMFDKPVFIQVVPAQKKQHRCYLTRTNLFFLLRSGRLTLFIACLLFCSNTSSFICSLSQRSILSARFFCQHLYTLSVPAKATSD